MEVRLYESWNHLDERWEYFVESETNLWSQRLWFGMGSILKDSNVPIYPFAPTWRAKKKLLKSYKGSHYNASWYGKRIAEKIIKQQLTKEQK